MTVLLLVEDDPAYPHLLRAQLARAWPQARLEHAPDLATAVQRLGEQDYDCVLVDLGLPDGHGLGNVRRLRAAAPGTPVVVLTGRDDERVLPADAAAVLRKHDASPEDLVAAVRAALARAR